MKNLHFIDYGESRTKKYSIGIFNFNSCQFNLCQALIVLLVFSDLDLIESSTHARIGKYKGVSVNYCGISCKTHLNDNKCKNYKNGQMSQKLMGGSNALGGEFPWMVSFQSNKTKRHFCGGALINFSWIITAAHCFTVNRKVDSFYIRTGSNKISDGYIERAFKYVLHPKFNLSDPTGPHDIALVIIGKKNRLKPRKHQLNSINGICLPEKGIRNEFDENAYYSGFGRTHYKGNRATSLMKTEMTLMSDHKCFPYINQFNMACLNTTSSHTCKGDSGSPLIQYVDNRAVLIGIHKGSIRKIAGKCGIQTAITTRVSQYIDWIIHTIRNN